MDKQTESFQHPETRAGEVFFSNVPLNELADLPWSTKRLGRVTYNGQGNRLAPSHWFPVFLETWELTRAGITDYAGLMEVRRAWRKNRAAHQGERSVGGS